MQTSVIIKEIESFIKERNCFLVEVNISKDNDITISIEKEVGDVQMDDCVAISQAFNNIFDREVEDYSLTVTSAGLDQPFIVYKQYVKAIGSQVEVKLKNGKKLLAKLLNATPDTITLSYDVKEAVEGKKKKELVHKEDVFNLTDVNSVKYHIIFE